MACREYNCCRCDYTEFSNSVKPLSCPKCGSYDFVSSWDEEPFDGSKETENSDEED